MTPEAMYHKPYFDVTNVSNFAKERRKKHKDLVNNPKDIDCKSKGDKECNKANTADKFKCFVIKVTRGIKDVYSFIDLQSDKKYYITSCRTIKLFESDGEPIMKLKENLVSFIGDTWNVSYIQKNSGKYSSISLKYDFLELYHQCTLKLINNNGESKKYLWTKIELTSNRLALIEKDSNAILMKYLPDPYKENKLKLYKKIDEEDLEIFILSIMVFLRNIDLE